MIFAYNADGRLEVVADVAEARRSFESDDIETGAILLFDERGQPLAPRFPQRKERKFLGIVTSSEPGPFEVEPAPPGEATLEESLGPTVVLMPNQWFQNLDAVRAHIRARPG